MGAGALMQDVMTLSPFLPEEPAIVLLPQDPPGRLSESVDGFQWPTPPFAIYSSAETWSEPQVCEIEGLNGTIRRCALVAMNPAEQTAMIQIENSRTPVPLVFSQFRRLTLKKPIQPQVGINDEAFSDVLGYRYTTQYQLHLDDGSTVSGLTVGFVETHYGLFVFTPLNDMGSVERVFIPRDAFLTVSMTEPDNQDLSQPLTVVPGVKTARAARAPAASPSKPDELPADMAVVSPEQLMQALDRQTKMPMMRVGEALIRLGYVDEAQLDQALELQKSDDSIPLGQLLVNMGFLTRRELNSALTHKMGYPVVDVTRFPIGADALRKISMATAQRLMIMPLLSRSSVTVVAAVDPTRRGMIDELEFLVQGRVIAALGDEQQIQQAIDTVYEKLGFGGWSSQSDATGVGAQEAASSSQLLESMELMEREHDEAEDESQIAQSDNTLVRLINTMIIEAFSRGVSDIHVESKPRHAKVRIRFRKDGLLSPYLELPHTYRAAVVARLKIMADLDISEKRKPQDGKIDFSKFSPRHRLELRIATVPTANGLEDVVMRLLSSAKPLPLDQLGLTQDNLDVLREAVSRPYGMVLCVGPTGSGKTTSLHSVLSFLNTPERKIWTAEDPIEITQPDLRQVQINAAIDWTFAKALRAFLRADPDVIMVGEIRDAETAHIAVEASLTGHLLLSTLHTNSAAETVTRLIDMGMNPFNFADSLLAVMGQRLVRRLCTHCRMSEPAPQPWVNELVDDYLMAFPDEFRPTHEEVLRQWMTRYGQDGGIKKAHAPGCSQCQGTGLSGRLGLHELMRVTPGLRRLIQTAARSELVQAEAFRSGKFRTLRQDGIVKVLEGITTIEEVRANSNA